MLQTDNLREAAIGVWLELDRVRRARVRLTANAKAPGPDRSRRPTRAQTPGDRFSKTPR